MTLSKLRQFVNEKQDDIILVIGVILISLLSFGLGYISAKQEKTSLQFEEQTKQLESGHYWSRDMRSLFGLEIG